MEEHDSSLNELRNSIRVARYDVDPVAVADAIVRRRWSLAVGRHGGGRVSTGPGQRRRTSIACIARRGSSIRALAA